MIRKRSLMSNLGDIKRKKLDSTFLNDIENGASQSTQSALLYLSSIFPVEKFQNRLPRIVLRHQIYAFISGRTEVDKCLNEMRKKGEIRLFRLGQKDEVAVVYMKDYQQHLERCCKNNATVGNFLNVIIQHPDMSFNKNTLINVHGLKEENISELVQQGVLTSQDVGFYWLAIPHMGEFVKALLYGRRATLQNIKRTKYKELLQSELQLRKLPQKALLGMLYHIYDIIGSDQVIRVETSTGIVLRLQCEQNSPGLSKVVSTALTSKSYM